MDAYPELIAFAQAAEAAESQQDWTRARLHYARALTMAEEAGLYAIQAALFDRLGQTLMRSGDVQDAVIAFESGLRALQKAEAGTSLDALTPSAGGPHRLDDVLSQLAAVGKQFGDFRQLAVPDLYSAPAAEALDQAAHDPLLAARLLLHVGNAYLSQPQEEPAYNTYRLALSLPEVAQASGLRGYLLANLGEIDRRRGHLAQAEHALVEALPLLDADGETATKRRALALLAGIARDQGHTDRAFTLYDQALDLYAQTDDRLGAGRTYAGLGHLHRQLRQCAQAEEAYRQARDLALRFGDTATLWQVNWGLGVCQQAAGHLDEAAASLRAALDLIELHHQDLRTDEGKVTFLDSVRTVYDQLIGVHVARAQTSPAAFADAAHVAEAARGRALRDLLGVQQRYRPASEDNQWPPSQADDGALFSPMAQMAPAFASPPPGLPSEPTSSPASAPETPPPAPLSRLLFHVLDDQTVVLALPAGGGVHGHIVPQGRDQVAARVARLRASLQVDTAPRGVAVARHISATPGVPGDEDPLPLLSAFYADFITPVADSLPPDGTLLVIEPHAALWLLPFAALRDDLGRWLADRWPLLYAPSQAVLDEIRAEPAAADPAAWTALIVGNPAMPHVPQQDGLEITLAPLPGAEQEATAIAAHFADPQRVLLTGAAADCATVTGLAPQHTIVHLATHGIAYSDDPRASFVALAEPPGGDGLLTVRRILDLANEAGLTATLVTLSACQTGLGRISGDGMIGLSRAFLVAGARTVLVSQWSVSDLATARLMESVYRHLLGGVSKTIALQRAMAELRQDPHYAHPRYWAAFCLVGAET